jgi:hypothetical protein
MVTHIRSAVAPRRVPPPPPPQPPEPSAGLLESLCSIEDEDHILVLGKDGLDLMCALLRAGAAQVTHLCSHERPEADSASLAIVPHVPSLDWLASALPSIRRALIANGRLVVAVAPQSITQNVVRRMLAVHGFTAIRMRNTVNRLVFRAELPAFGLRRCA